MQKRKNGIAIAALALSATVFVSTAVADVMLGSGYEGLKDALKTTAAQTEKGLDNFTVEAAFTIKDNGVKRGEFTSLTKYDNMNKVNESTSTEDFKGQKPFTNYRYLDTTQSITKHNDSDTYYVSPINEKRFARERVTPPNPFSHENAQDIERIFDAAVGSLKDNVQVTETDNGGKSYSGSIEEIQVPALVNAIASFGLKQATTSMNRNGHDDVTMPVMVKDIYIKKVSGNLLADKTGLVQSMVGEVIFSGVDKNDQLHELSIGGMFAIKDLHTTIIKKPDLEGKKIEKVSRSENGLDARHVGTYKNNIVIVQNDQYVKIGERVLTISSVDDKKLVGRYKETYKEGFGEYTKEKKDIAFEMGMESYSQFAYTNAKGETEYGRISPNGDGKIYLSLFEEKANVNEDGSINYVRSKDTRDQNFDGQLDRVFEE